MRICFTEYSVWHAWHAGSCFTSSTNVLSLYDLYEVWTKWLPHFIFFCSFVSIPPNVGLISSYLLCILLFKCFWLCCRMYLFIFILESVYGIWNIFPRLGHFCWFQDDLGPSISVNHYHLINFLICIEFLWLFDYKISYLLTIPTLIANQKR